MAKFAYLKNPSRPRFKMMVAINQSLRLLCVFAAAMAFPSSQSPVDEMKIRGRNR